MTNRQVFERLDAVLELLTTAARPHITCTEDTPMPSPDTDTYRIRRAAVMLTELKYWIDAEPSGEDTGPQS